MNVVLTRSMGTSLLLTPPAAASATSCPAVDIRTPTLPPLQRTNPLESAYRYRLPYTAVEPAAYARQSECCSRAPVAESAARALLPLSPQRPAPPSPADRIARRPITRSDS